MALFDRLRSWGRTAPRAAASDAGRLITTPEELEEAMRGGTTSTSGEVVTANTAMRTAVVFRSVSLISGTTSTMPWHLKRRVDAKTRVDAEDHSLWQVLMRRPNRYQMPMHFRRMMEMQKLLHGAGYALIVRSLFGSKQVTELIPFHPGTIVPKQKPDLSIEYHYTSLKGVQRIFQQNEIFVLMGMTFDGFTGVSPITYARESIGAALSMERHGNNVFKNGAQTGGVLSHPGTLGQEGQDNLRHSLAQYKGGGQKAGEDLILEEGMKWEPRAMSASDAQWIEARKFSRSDIGMFYGVPPHMYGDTEKSPGFGNGLEQQTQGFVTFTLEEHLSTWEQSVMFHLLDPEKDKDVYLRYNRSALVRGDLKSRWEANIKQLQFGVYSPNEIRAREDDDPREGGDEYYDPPNTAGTPGGANDEPTETT